MVTTRKSSRKKQYGGAGVNNPVNAAGRTQLYVAAINGNLEEVNRLIAAGANVNKARTDTELTPLYAAAFNNHQQVVERLVQAGADVNKGISPPLYIASFKGYENVVDSLINGGANVNKPSSHGGNLYVASQEGHINIVNKLIAAGADVNRVEIRGETPLFMASRQGHLNVVKKLIESGADINKHIKSGITPLYTSIEFGKPGVAEYLIAAGADVNKGDNAFPLYLAARKSNMNILERLINAGADINKKLKDSGATSLFAAAFEGHLDIVKRLLDAGADKTIVNRDMKRASDYASTSAIRNFINSYGQNTSTALKWQGWSRGDATMLDGIFGDDATAKNFALCPVCMKYVVRSDACMYMSHNCAAAKGYYHEDLYTKYKNREGIINWCTVCGRICKGHNHFNLAPAQGPVPPVVHGSDPFASSCEVEGGGGITEKLLRFRRLREHAKDLQDEVGKMDWRQAMDELCEEMWNAPMVRARTLKTMLAEKKFNIPDTNFPLTLPEPENAPNIPYMGETPIVHPHETEAFTNALYIDDANILQFRHKKADGSWNRHEGPGQQISREAFIAFMKSMLENPTAEEFGKCWQFKTRSQQAALSVSEKALVCDATLHPEEVKAALDLADPEQARLAEGYRKAFNAAFDKRKMQRH